MTPGAEGSVSGAVPFPRGLLQPEGAYRFGLDALLLAAFAARTLRERAAGGRASGKARPRRVAELGTGCGAALLGVALRCPDARCLGLEREPALLRAAAANAQALGLADRVSFHMADLAAPAAWPGRLGEEGPQDLVLANPPWGLPGRGRPSPSRLREATLASTSSSSRKPRALRWRERAPRPGAKPRFHSLGTLPPTPRPARYSRALAAPASGLRMSWVW